MTGQASNYDVSIVSAFFDIGRGSWPENVNGLAVPQWLVRSTDTYFAWFDNLARLKNQIVVFTEKKFAAPILEIRKRHGLEAMTSIMVCDDLFGPDGRLAQLGTRFQARMRPELHAFVLNPGCPEYWNADYVMINALKSVFICEAIKLGLNAHQQVAWIDFGYCRDDRRFDCSTPWRFDCGDRMNLFYIREPDDRPIFDIVRTGDVYFQGCHFVGPARSWFCFKELMDEAMASLLACGLVDDDQTTILMAYRRAPELFRIHAVDPSDWFVVLRDFSTPCPANRSLEVPGTVTSPEFFKEA